MNFICDLLLRNWLPTIFALEADPNVVPSSRQSGIGRCRSNLEWRELGDWNRTSSTLVSRSRTVGLGGASVVLTLVTNQARDRISARLVRSWQSPLSNFSLDR